MDSLEDIVRRNRSVLGKLQEIGEVWRKCGQEFAKSETFRALTALTLIPRETEARWKLVAASLTLPPEMEAQWKSMAASLARIDWDDFHRKLNPDLRSYASIPYIPSIPKPSIPEPSKPRKREIGFGAK